MSYKTITQCTRDQHFQDRVQAGAMKEAIANPSFGDTVFGEQLRQYPQAALNVFMWPLSVDNEDDYAYAVETDNPDPGGDPGVISDAKIQSGVQTHWPADPVAVPIIPDPSIQPEVDDGS